MKMLTPQNSRSRHGQIWSHGLSQVVCCVAGSWKPPRAARPHHGPIPSHPIPSRPREPRGLPAAMPGTARFFHLRDDRAPPLSTGDWTPIHACRLRAGSAQVSRLSRTANERPRGRTLPRGPVAVRSPSSRLAPGGGRRTGDSRAFRSQSNRRRVMARPLFFFTVRTY